MTDRRPDVLLIMTEQQRFDTLACQGNDLIHTPNLDRLVARGVTGFPRRPADVHHQPVS